MRVYKKEQNHAATYPLPLALLDLDKDCALQQENRIFNALCKTSQSAEKSERKKEEEAEKAENKNEKLLCTARRRQIARQVFGGWAWQAVKGGRRGVLLTANKINSS